MTKEQKKLALDYMRAYIKEHRLTLSPSLWRQVESASEVLRISYDEAAEIMEAVMREKMEEVILIIKNHKHSN